VAVSDEPMAEQADCDDPSTSTPPETTLAVILAAGEGSRYVGGQHKLEAKLARKPILWWATHHALAAGFVEVLVIEGAIPVVDLVPQQASIAHNDDWADGQSQSLQVAVHYANIFGYDELVVGLGDQPFAPPEAWRRIAAATDRPIAVAQFGDRQTPPVRLHRDVWGLLPLDGDEGARQLLRSRPELVTPVACPGSAVDVDTAAELDHVRRLHFTKELGTWT
jgi:CTP:molybdopterin cytidylyltransferase MocA